MDPHATQTPDPALQGVFSTLTLDLDPYEIKPASAKTAGRKRKHASADGLPDAKIQRTDQYAYCPVCHRLFTSTHKRNTSIGNATCLDSAARKNLPIPSPAEIADMKDALGRSCNRLEYLEASNDILWGQRPNQHAPSPAPQQLSAGPSHATTSAPVLTAAPMSGGIATPSAHHSLYGANAAPALPNTQFAFGGSHNSNNFYFNSSPTLSQNLAPGSNNQLPYAPPAPWPIGSQTFFPYSQSQPGTSGVGCYNSDAATNAVLYQHNAPHPAPGLGGNAYGFQVPQQIPHTSHMLPPPLPTPNQTVALQRAPSFPRVQQQQPVHPQVYFGAIPRSASMPMIPHQMHPRPGLQHSSSMDGFSSLASAFGAAPPVLASAPAPAPAPQVLYKQRNGRYLSKAGLEWKEHVRTRLEEEFQAMRTAQAQSASHDPPTSHNPAPDPDSQRFGSPSQDYLSTPDEDPTPADAPHSSTLPPPALEPRASTPMNHIQSQPFQNDAGAQLDVPNGAATNDLSLQQVQPSVSSAQQQEAATRLSFRPRQPDLASASAQPPASNEAHAHNSPHGAMATPPSQRPPIVSPQDIPSATQIDIVSPDAINSASPMDIDPGSPAAPSTGGGSGSLSSEIEDALSFLDSQRTRYQAGLVSAPATEADDEQRQLDALFNEVIAHSMGFEGQHDTLDYSPCDRQMGGASTSTSSANTSALQTPVDDLSPLLDYTSYGMDGLDHAPQQPEREQGLMLNLEPGVESWSGLPWYLYGEGKPLPSLLPQDVEQLTEKEKWATKLNSKNGRMVFYKPL